MLIGMDSCGVCQGMQVISQSETPGPRGQCQGRGLLWPVRWTSRDVLSLKKAGGRHRRDIGRHDFVQGVRLPGSIRPLMWQERSLGCREESKMSAIKEFKKGLWAESPTFVLLIGMCPTMVSSTCGVKCAGNGACRNIRFGLQQPVHSGP